MSKFQNIQVSDSAELVHIITQQDVDKFVELTGDNNKLHVDSQYAEGTSLKKPVAHGMLGASFISTIIGTKLPGDGALWFAQNLEFLLPVRVGDRITVRAEVTKKHEATATIELKTEIFNQHRQRVTVGTAKVKIVEQTEKRPASKPEDNRKRTALVVGATGGIGGAVCERLAQDGFRVLMHYCSNENRATELRNNFVGRDLDVAIFKADIINEQQVKEMIEQILRRNESIDVLVNCSTVKIPPIRLADVQWGDLQAHFDINVRGTFNLIKHVVPSMELNKRGKIINLVTQFMESTPPPLFLPYITAKSALHGFSKALAVELAPKGITVNMISPGITETELIADMSEKSRLLVAARTPLKRLAVPADVANVVGFLASSNADYITGETIRVSGGQVML